MLLYNERKEHGSIRFMTSDDEFKEKPVPNSAFSVLHFKVDNAMYYVSDPASCSNIKLQ